MTTIVFSVISICVALTGYLFSILVFIKKNHDDFYMGMTICLSATVDVFYLLSVLAKKYFFMSLFSSFYFGCITIMLVFLLIYILNYTKMYNFIFKNKILLFILWGSATFDLIVQLINPFWEISLNYAYVGGNMAQWKYEPKFLYVFHLTLCYVLITLVFAALIVRIIRTPSVYRQKYLAILSSLIFVVALNGVYLFIPLENNIYDFSVLFYSIIGFFMFWNRYYYSSHGMLGKVRQTVLDEFDQPIFLFDENNELTMHNISANIFVDLLDLNKNCKLSDFAKSCRFPLDVNKVEQDVHFQWNPDSTFEKYIFRVDVKRLKDKRNKRYIGTLITMADNSLEMDLLTGFHCKNSFETYFRSQAAKVTYPAAITICDINKLTIINKKYGEQEGDKAIQLLARLMRKYFPRKTYFARLTDANLVAVSPDTDINQMRDYLALLRLELRTVTTIHEKLEIQSAIAIATEENPGILEAVETAMFSVRSKKLMDGNSAHSSLLDSIAQILLESDSTTRAHVQRTRDMGELLGQRLGLSDIQQSKLDLLCLLHDVGKLGIPLEILNKPGKLNQAEWDVMKSHVDKGYRIAKASTELEDIADLILHHHESWNGKGYPDGLQQESIPLLSRIIAVVDTYDAITNDRPYHKAESDAAARKELKRCAGVQFDPSIISIFMDLLEELHPLKDQPQEEIEEKNSKEVSTPRGVNEIFSQEETVEENDNIQPIKYTRYILNGDNKVISIDENFYPLTGYEESDLEKYNLHQVDLIPPEDREDYLKMVASYVGASGEAYFEHKLLRKDGGIRNVVCFGKQYFDSVTRQPKIEITVFDEKETAAYVRMQIEERQSAKRSMEKWEALMRRDSLTGLLNHESFINDVEMELLRDDQRVLLMILDVDYFKVYNDTYGHQSGDKLLSLVALMLQNSVNGYGFAGRLGGDEFAAVIRLPKDCSEHKIKAMVENSFNMIINATSTQSKPATISLGAAYLVDKGSFSELYNKADKALYDAKENGKKCYCIEK